MLHILLFAASRISSIFATCRSLVDAYLEDLQGDQVWQDGYGGHLRGLRELRRQAEAPRATHLRVWPLPIILQHPHQPEAQARGRNNAVFPRLRFGLVLRNIWNEPYAYWGFQPHSPQQVRETYRKRLAIETTYRQMNEARMGTCTRSPLRRLFFFAVAMILRDVWVWFRLTTLSRPEGRRLILHLEGLRSCDLLLHLQRPAQATLGITRVLTAQLAAEQLLATT